MAVLLKAHVLWGMSVCQTSVPWDLKDFFKVEQSNKNSCVGRKVHYTMYNNMIYSECDLCKILHFDMLDEM
jgi:hypothetical protein